MPTNYYVTNVHSYLLNSFVIRLVATLPCPFMYLLITLNGKSLLSETSKSIRTVILASEVPLSSLAVILSFYGPHSLGEVVRGGGGGASIKTKLSLKVMLVVNLSSMKTYKKQINRFWISRWIYDIMCPFLVSSLQKTQTGCTFKWAFIRVIFHS